MSMVIVLDDHATGRESQLETFKAANYNKVASINEVELIVQDCKNCQGVISINCPPACLRWVSDVQSAVRPAGP
jgi:hypothetical protein